MHALRLLRYAARVLDQSSTFGAVLDMMTDRTSTTCLCVVLARLYPQLIVPLIALVFLDLFSHWYHMYASLLLGNTSHKMCENALVNVYYYRPVLFIICSGTECWYISLYTLAFTRGPPLPLLGYPLGVSFFALCTPVFVFKQVANVVQLFIACQSIVAHDEASRAARQGSKQVRASPRKRSKSPLKKNQ